MDENFVMIFSSTDEKVCKKAKTVLKKAKIDSLIQKKNENNVFIGEFEIFVKMNDMGAARTILKGLNIE